VIVPVFNEEDSLREFHGRLAELAGSMPQVDMELLFIDDHSTDSTPGILSDLAKNDSRIRIIRLSRNCGSHSAIYTGLIHCTGDAACTIPADLQAPPQLIFEMVSKLNEGFLTVWAYRKTRNGGAVNLYFSNLYNDIMARYVLPGRWNQGADVFLVDRSVIDQLRLHWRRNSNLFALLAWLNMKPAQIGYDQQARRAGQSKWTTPAKIKLLLDTLFSLSVLPLRAVMFLGVLVTLFGIGVLFMKDPESGGNLSLPAVFILIGSLLLSSGIFGEYIWRSRDKTRNDFSCSIERKTGFPDR